MRRRKDCKVCTEVVSELNVGGIAGGCCVGGLTCQKRWGLIRNAIVKEPEGTLAPVRLY